MKTPYLPIEAPNTEARIDFLASPPLNDATVTLTRDGDTLRVNLRVEDSADPASYFREFETEWPLLMPEEDGTPHPDEVGPTMPTPEQCAAVPAMLAECAGALAFFEEATAGMALTGLASEIRMQHQRVLAVLRGAPPDAAPVSG